MNREEALKLTDESLEELSRSLERGSILGLKEFLEFLAKFPNYSYRNIFLIRKQYPDATQVKGYAAWKDAGRAVISGEHGIGIIAPMAIRVKEESEDETGRQVSGFRLVHVFDIRQTKPLDGASTLETSDSNCAPLLAMEVVFQKLGIYLETTILKLGTYGSSHGGSVKIDHKLNQDQRFQVLAHELAHELLHKSKEQMPPKAVRELEAEAVSYVVSKVYGFGSLLDATNYIHGYGGDQKLLARSLKCIQTTALEILNHLDDCSQSGMTHEEVQDAA